MGKEDILLACAQGGTAELCSVGSSLPSFSALHVGHSKGDVTLLMQGEVDHPYLQEASPTKRLGCTKKLNVMPL